MAKYDPLHRHLADSSESILLMAFADIERILGVALPASARKHAAWWANERTTTHSQNRSWLDADYETARLDLNGQTVEFVRRPYRGEPH